MFVAILVLTAIVLIASCAGPMISRTEYFQDNPPTSSLEHEIVVAENEPSVNCDATQDSELVGRHRLRPHINQIETNTEHIEDIRKVLSRTIRSLKKDDVLPSGSRCSCASAPVLSGQTGEVEAADRCRPPGWLRMMNSRNDMENNELECSNHIRV